MARKLEVEIVGDSRSVEAAFARSAKSAQKFNEQVTRNRGSLSADLQQQARAVRSITAAEEQLIKVRSKRASSLGPFRVAGVGLAAGLGLFAATQAVRELGDRLAVTGKAAFTTEGRIRNMVSALTSGNLVGVFDALTRQPETLSDLGRSALTAGGNLKALKQVAAGTTEVLRSHFSVAKVGREEVRRLAAIEEAAGVSSRKMAQEILYGRAMAQVSITAFEGLGFAAAQMGQQFLNAAGDLVTFKGAADDIAGMRGPGARAYDTPFKRKTKPSRGPLSPSQRRELGLIGAEGTARVPALQERLRQLRNQKTTTDAGRLRVLTNIKETEAEIAGIYKDQAAAAKTAAEAAKRAAEARIAAAKAAREQALATKLGWLELAAEKADWTKPIKDNLDAQRAIIKYWQERIRQEGRKLELVSALLRAQHELRELSKSQTDDPFGALAQVSSKRLAGILAAGTGLGAAGRRVLGANISGQNITVYSHVLLDGATVARNTSKHQAKSGQRTANQTSGRRG